MTFFFALLVLLILGGVIVALVDGAIPALRTFGFSFVFAWLCVRWLLRYIATHTFIPFAWYRIAFGLVVLATWLTGMVHWAD